LLPINAGLKYKPFINNISAIDGQIKQSLNILDLNRCQSHIN
jgi:hypothetical protein